MKCGACSRVGLPLEAGICEDCWFDGAYGDEDDYRDEGGYE